MICLDDFALIDTMECGSALRRAASDAQSMEEAAGIVVRYLRDELVDKRTGQPTCPLVRFYKTHPYSGLEPETQEFVHRRYPGEVPPQGDVQCLSLLATAGLEPAWNDRHLSESHQAIPLPSVGALEQAPMISQLIRQLGVDPGEVLAPPPDALLDRGDRQYNVFYVADAEGSPYIPAQDSFVDVHGIKSVLGFGGLLPSGELFAVILFSTTAIPRQTAELFRYVALSVELAILPFAEDRVFASGVSAATSHPAPPDGVARAVLESLLDVTERTASDQMVRLQQARRLAEDRAEALVRSETALRDSEARARAVARASLDAIVTMNAVGEVIGWNPAAELTFGWTADEVTGLPLSEVVVPPSLRRQHTEGLRRYLETGEEKVLGRRVELTAVRRDGAEFPVELTIARVDLPGPPTFVGYIRDITGRLLARQELEDSRERFAHIARTLQHSLLPPHLPAIADVDLGARYIAAGDGVEVGGDFYDVFETAGSDWAVVLGDVCGKGPEAAAVTALARYTIRTLAMAFRQPSEILTVLNQAVLRQHPERYCTAVYARVRPRGGGIDVTLGCGGHPAPLLARADGSTSWLSESSCPPIGMFESIEPEDQRAALREGDVLVMYTDGVIEARGDNREFTDADLERMVAELVRRRASADEIADVIASTALEVDGGSARDDIAVVVLKCEMGRRT